MITKEADYAIRTVLYLAKHEGEGAVSTKDMAEKMYIPYRFLRKIVQKLSESGIIESQRGKGGGVLLNTPKENLSLYDILKIFDAKSIRFNSCHMEDASCPRMDFCAVHVQMDKVQQELNEKLKDITFDTLL